MIAVGIACADITVIVLALCSNVGMGMEPLDFIAPFGWLAAMVGGPGPFFVIPYLGIGAQLIIYIAFLKNAHSCGRLLSRVLSLSLVHLTAVAFIALVQFLDHMKNG